MKKFLTLVTVLLGLQATAAFAGDWYCSTQSSRGYNYTWQSYDYNDAFRQSSNTCARYESGYGYCYATNCQQLGGGYPPPGGGYPPPPPPPRRTLLWHCDVQSFNGRNYSWENVDYGLAERGAVQVCQRYERPYGGRCGLPRCYQR